MNLASFHNEIGFLNGDYLPLKDIQISPFDRGFLFGDGIYEVTPIYNNKPLGEKEHYQRLIKSLAEVGIKSPYTLEEWTEKMNPLLDANNSAEMLYIQVTRGVEPVRKHRFPVDVLPTVFAFVMSFKPPISLDYQGCSAHLLPDLRWQRCDVKSISLIGNILAYHQLYEKGAEKDEALLTRTDGKNTHIVECPSSNIFAVVDDVIVTPPLDNILVGVTRGMVIEDAKRLGLPIIECPLSVENLARASEVWVTNSYEELKPVVKIDGKPVGDGKTGQIWEQLFSAYQERKD